MVRLVTLLMCLFCLSAVGNAQQRVVGFVQLNDGRVVPVVERGSRRFARRGSVPFSQTMSRVGRNTGEPGERWAQRGELVRQWWKERDRQRREAAARQEQARQARERYMERMAARAPSGWQTRSILQRELGPNLNEGYERRAREASERYAAADARAKGRWERFKDANRRSNEASQRYAETFSTRARREWVNAANERHQMLQERQQAIQDRDRAARETKELREKAKDSQDRINEWRERQEKIYDRRP